MEMKRPLQSGPLAAPTAPTVASTREFSRPVLLTDEAAAEQRLIQAVREGDSSAFGTLVGQHLPRALALATRLLRQKQDAEDLVQDAFLSALRHIGDFDANRPFWPWLSRIIVNRGIDLAASRSLRSTEPLSDQFTDGGELPSARVERSDLFDRVRRAVAVLPPRRRMVVELFELDGFSINEIAEFLDSSPATIRWHLHVGRRQLRDALVHLRGVSA